jgi:integrase
MSRRSGQSGSVEKKGKHFVVRFWQDRKGQARRVHRSIRICPVSGPGSMTKPEREHRAREIIQESGADTAEHFLAVRAVNLGVSYREQAEQWLREVEGRKGEPVKPRTVGNWKSHLAWILPRLGDVPLADITPRVAKELVAQMWAAKLSPKTIRNYFFVVAAVIASATDEDGQQQFPRKWDRKFLDLPKVDKTNQKRPTYTAADVEAIISRADGQEAMLYALLAGTGLRVGEALGLKVQHFSGGSLKIEKALWNGVLYDPKTTNGIRVVDLSQGLAQMLREHIGARRDGYIFQTAKGSPLHQSNVLRRSLHLILAKLGREETAGFHGFRRFRVTHLRKQETPEDLLRFWIGHGDKSVTDGYSKLAEDVEYRKAVAERVGTGFRLEVVPCCPPTFESDAGPQVVMM